MKYYCIGIKGTGMSTLAQILSDLGNTVSGYDDAKGHKFTQDGLEERNIPIYYGHDHEIDKDTIVTYSVAFGEDHPEMKRVRELGLTVKRYCEIMGDVIDMFKTIGVSGTHGKTSTSSMIRKILEDSIGCNYFIGAGDGHASRDNEYFVVESDEFNRHFTAYHPTYSIITNIEAEHMEIYKDVDDIRNTFEIFANQTKDFIIANGDNEEVRKINYKTKVYFYGFNDNNDIIIKDMDLEEDGSKFRVEFNGEDLGEFFIPLYGKHMVMNACSAIVMCKLIGINIDSIRESLRNFQNAKRRFAVEVYNGSIIVDDYAHHPTEIRVTLEGVRQKYPNKRLVVVFAPNTYSRTRDFTKEFVEAFKIADKTYLTEIDCNREDPKDYPGITSKSITEKLDGAEIISMDTLDELLKEKDSVVCFMGCAPSVEHLLNKYKELLQK